MRGRNARQLVEKRTFDVAARIEPVDARLKGSQRFGGSQRAAKGRLQRANLLRISHKARLYSNYRSARVVTFWSAGPLGRLRSVAATAVVCVGWRPSPATPGLVRGLQNRARPCNVGTPI